MSEPCTDLRNHMPVGADFAYFDHAAVSPLPALSAQAMADYAFTASTSGCAQWLQWSAAVAQLRQTAARLVVAKTEEVALVNNTTQGINLIAEGFPWKAGDNVVVPENEFPSNLLPWRNLARRGVELRTVKVPPSGEITPDAIRQVVDHRSRLIAISWVGFTSGFRIDVAKFVELAHDCGCLLMLDAIQGLGAFPLNVRDTNVDFFCADGHKWMLGPEGAGLMYIKQEHLNLLEPLGLGWGSLATGAFDPASVEIKQAADRYEGGSTNMSGMIGFGESLKILEDCGAGRADSPIAAAVLENVAELQALLTAADFEVHLPSDPSRRSGILGISWAGGQDLAQSARVYAEARKFLLERKIMLSVRGGRLRVSTHAYNNEQDRQRLVEALDNFRG
ncbi:MAG: aminotransferase class V-fold PLP-dependent enzyme [Pirellulaceae bacterium]